MSGTRGSDRFCTTAVGSGSEQPGPLRALNVLFLDLGFWDTREMSESYDSF